MIRDVFACAMLMVGSAASASAQDDAAQRALRPDVRVEDEYARIELLAPDTNSMRVTYDLSVVTAGSTSYSSPIPRGAQASGVSVVDVMTGEPLRFAQTPTQIDVTLARPVPKEGQARIRVIETLRDPEKYHPAGNTFSLTRVFPLRRYAIVLPKGYELGSTNYPVQVIQESDGRIAVNFMNPSRLPAAMTIIGRALKNPPAGAPQADAAVEQHPQAAADAPPPPVQMDQIRVTERAIQDREIVYFLKQPEAHAFSLYHDYTASREGEHQYVNVVRTGSTVSDPSAMILDTGEVLKTRTLTGADIAREKIEINERVDPDTEVVLIPFTPVKKGTSIRLRISETYTDPARYALVNGQLMWHRSFGRNRNDMVLPDGWYLTTSSIPAVISTERDGRIRLSFWNGRPDNVDVFVKGSRR